MTSTLKYFVLIICCITGCNQSGEWQHKYEGCKTLASVMKKDPTPFFAIPDCELIPKLCSKSPQSAECVSELSKYTQK